MLVTWVAGSAASAETRPNRPTAHSTALTEMATASTQPGGVRWGQVHSWLRIRCHWRPSAPCRTGCSMNRQDRAASTSVAAICRLARTTLGAALSGVVRTITG